MCLSSTGTYTCTLLVSFALKALGLEAVAGLVQAWVRQNITFLRYHSGMGLGDSSWYLKFTLF